MILVLGNGKKVDTNDPEAMEKAFGGGTEIMEKSGELGETRESASPAPDQNVTPVPSVPVAEDSPDSQDSHPSAVEPSKIMEKADDGKPGESLDETSTKELKTTLEDIKSRLKKKPGDSALKAREKAISAALSKRQPPDFGAKSMDAGPSREPDHGKTALDALEEFSKAIYIGPRGGRWLDPKHTIPWKPEGSKVKTKKPAAEKPKGKATEKDKADALEISKRADALSHDYESAVSDGSPASMVAMFADVAQSAHKKAAKAERAVGNDWNADRHALYAKVIAKQVAGSGGDKPIVPAPPKKTKATKREKDRGAAESELETVKKKNPKLFKERDQLLDAIDAAHDSFSGVAEAESALKKFDLKNPVVARAVEQRNKKVTAIGKRPLETGEKDIFARFDKPTAKSLDAWIEEQETAMKPENEENADLVKALGDDAELAKGMYGPDGGCKNVLEWAGQFWSDTGLEKEALQCVKDQIECQKKWAVYHKNGKPYQETRDMSGAQRDAYRAKRDKERDAISKVEDTIRVRMRGLESKLVDYRLKEASIRQAMGKSGTDVLNEFVKGGDASVEPVVEPEPELESEPAPEASGAEVLSEYLGKAIPEPAGGQEPVAAPNSYVEAPRSGPPDQMTTRDLSVPGHQRDMVAHRTAQVVSKLRKGPDDISIAPGGPAREAIPEPVHKSRTLRHDDTLEVCDSGADAAAARMAKGEDFWEGGGGPAIGQNPSALTSNVRCPACESAMSKSLAMCPHCGHGAGDLVMSNPAQNMRKSGPVLRAARAEPDILIEQ